MPNIDFGCKYDFRPDENPSPGTYDPKNTLIKEKSRSVIIPYEKKKDPFKNTKM